MKIYQQIYKIAKICLLIGMPAICSAATMENIGFDDWVISNTCSQNANKLCQGYYRQPNFSQYDTSLGSKQPISITSDEANFVSKGTSVFNGKVIAEQGDKFIYANKATVKHNEKSGDLETITAIGKVKILQPGIRVDGKKATAFIPQDKKVIDDAVFRLYARRARGISNQLVIFGSDVMQLKKATYTTCAPNSNSWYLQADEINLNKITGQGEAWHAKMYIKDTPVFYWPYVNFPIDDRRQSGFLHPAYESTSNSGKTLVLPFYWNIAPNYDSSIVTRYMSLRGFKFDTVTRYLSESSSGKVLFDFLPQDRAYQALRNEQYAEPSFMQSTDPLVALRRNDLKPRDYRYSVTVKHNTRFNKKTSFNINYTDASDGNYLNDFNTGTWNYADNQGSTIYALQSIALNYNDFFGASRLKFEQYKTFYAARGPAGQQQLSKLPELMFNAATFNLPYNYSWLINANFTVFKPRIVTDNNFALDYGQRLFARPALMYAINEPGWFIQPRAQLNFVQYSNVQLTKASIAQGTDPNRSQLILPMLDLKSGLIFERSTVFKSTDLIQTLEPIVYYLYVPTSNKQNSLPNFDTQVNNFDYNQVFRDNRFAGYDRVAAANQFGLGLASKLFDNTSGEEIGMLGVGQIRYLTPNTVANIETGNIDQHWSPIAMLAKLRVAPKYTLEGNWIVDSQSTKTASVQLQYRADPTKVINFGYEYVRSTEPDDLTGQTESNVKQLNISTAWDLNSRFRVLGKYTYDLIAKRDFYILGGIEYHTCCTALRFVVNRILQAEPSNNRNYINGFGIQFVFKGFTGVGKVTDQEIAALIPGYNADITTL